MDPTKRVPIRLQWDVCECYGSVVMTVLIRNQQRTKGFIMLWMCYHMGQEIIGYFCKERLIFNKNIEIVKGGRCFYEV